MEPDAIDLKLVFGDGHIRVRITEYDSFEQVISGLRGLGSEEYLRALWENLVLADEEIGTGGRVDVYDLLDSGAVDAGDQPKWLDSIHDFVYEGGDDDDS